MIRRGILGVLLLLVLLEVAGRLGLVDSDVVPYVSVVLPVAAGLVADPEFLADIGRTLAACAQGLLIAILVAVPAGILFGVAPAVERSVRPLVEFLRPIPSVCLIPLALFLFAATDDAKVALVVYTCAWPLLINTMYGLGDVDPLAKETLRSYGFSGWAVVWRVALPSAAPFIATGIRIAVSVTLIVAVSVELIAPGTGGIGGFISESGGAGRTDRMLGGVIWAGLIGVAANAAFTYADRRLFHWHRREVT